MQLRWIKYWTPAEETEMRKTLRSVALHHSGTCKYMRQLGATPFCNYSVSIWCLSTWLWLLPIKEIRLKMFQHERQQWKTTSGLLFPSNMRAKPHGLAVQASKWGKQSHALLERNLVSARAHHQQREVPVWACSDLHETIACLLPYSTFRKVADPYWIANSFLSPSVFCCHTVLITRHKGQVCLPPSPVPSWNGKLAEMWKRSGLRSWYDYCYRVEQALKNLWDFSSFSQGGSDGQEISRSCLAVVSFAFIYTYVCMYIWICFN